MTQYTVFQAAREFLNRVELKGGEVHVFNQVVDFINRLEADHSAQVATEGEDNDAAESDQS